MIGQMLFAIGVALVTASGSAAADLLDVVYTVTPRPLVVDVHTPTGTPPFPVIVWIHGGGWRSGDEDLHGDHAALRQRARGYAVVSIEYRLSGEAKFPAQIQDCKAALRWLRAEGPRYGLDPDRVLVWGSSAGGHLAALVGTSAGVATLDPPYGDPATATVRAVIDWYGPSDLVSLSASGAQAAGAGLLGCFAADCPDLAALASPISHVDASDPPFLIEHGTADPVVDPQQSELLHAALLAAAVPSQLVWLPGAGHGGPQFNEPPNLALIEAFIDRHLR